MAFQQVERIDDRYLSEWRLIKTPYQQHPMTLQRWRELNAEDPIAADALVIGTRQLIEITQAESWANDDTDDWEPLRDKYQPLAERGGIWWLVGKHHSGREGVETYNTPSKNLEIGDVWEDTVQNTITWYENDDEGLQRASRADVILTRDGSIITKVEYK